MCSFGDAPGLGITCLQSQISRVCAARTVFQHEFHWFFMHITSLAVFLEISVAHGSITFCFEIFPSHCKFYTCSWAQLHTGGERRETKALFQNLVSCLESMFPHHRCTPDTKAFLDTMF